MKLVWLTAALLLLALAGCGSDKKSEVVTKTVVTTQTHTVTAPAPTGAVKSLAFFRTPSGNIACGMGTGAGARCDIADHSWTAPPKPADCDLDWGNGIEVQDSKGAFACAGDTLLGEGDTLAYGETSEKGPFRCVSQMDGVTCTNTSTHHGFAISIDKYRLF